MAKEKAAPAVEILPWEQQPGETAKKYSAFLCYLNMKTDEEDRSLRKVAQQLNKSLTYIGTLSSENDWVARAEAWDRDQLAKAQRKNEKRMQKMLSQHANISSAMINLVAKRLAKTTPDELTMQDMRQIFEIATKTERISRGFVGEVIEERDGGKVMNPVQIYLPDNGREEEQDDDEGGDAE